MRSWWEAGVTFFDYSVRHLFNIGLAWTIDAFTNKLIIAHRLEGSIETTLLCRYDCPAGLSVVFKLTAVKTEKGYLEWSPKWLYQVQYSIRSFFGHW